MTQRFTCWAARTQKLADLVTDIFRCERIAELYRNDPDQEVRDYCASQSERAVRLSRELRMSWPTACPRAPSCSAGVRRRWTAWTSDLGKAAQMPI